MADMLGMSRTPVREALIELSREGVIEKLPQRGFILRSITEAERDEVFGLRELLETFVVGRLAATATDSQVRALREILTRQSRSRDDPDEFLQIDEELHLGMAEMLGFERTKYFLLQLRGITWLSGYAAVSRRNRLTAVLSEHRDIVERVAAHDAKAAVAAIRRHIARTHEAVQRATLSSSDVTPTARRSPASTRR